MTKNTRHQEMPYLGPRQYPLFRLYGFDVKIDLSWLLLALLITWTLAAGMFPAHFPDLARKTYWWMGIAGAAGVFFSIVFHEFAHSLVARRFGLPIGGITLFIFGGVAEMEDEPPSAESEFWVAIAGPLSSFVLAFFFYLIHAMSSASGLHASIIGVSYYLMQINLIVATFNLVPAFPLDGGRVLRAGLWKWKNSLQFATRVSSQIGSLFGWLLIILGVLAFIQGNFIGGMWWLLIGTFLRGAAAASYSHMMMRDALFGKPISGFMNANPLVVPASISIKQLVDDYVYKHHLDMLPVAEDSKFLGCITAQDVKKIPSDDWGQHQVSELMVPCSSENTVPPDADAMQVLRMMMKRDAMNRVMVVDRDRLAGIVSLNDLREYLSLKMELGMPRR